MEISQPWNIWPMDVAKTIQKDFLKEVTSPLIYEPSTKNFHPDGLYSEVIFGQVGSPARMGTLAYIRLNCQVIAPLIYLNLIKVSSWYQDLMESRVWAKFDNKLKDFVPCDKTENGAQTGFTFFMSHVSDVNFTYNNSPSRTNRIDSILKAINTKTQFIRECIVPPAGWRDVKVDNGRDKVDEANKPYTSLLIMSREMRDSITSPDLIPFFDGAKYHIQLKIVEIFNYWKNFWDGKTGFGLSRYNKRGLALGTRNVITVAVPDAKSPKDPGFLKHNETQTPLFVAAKMFEPKTVHSLNLLFYQPIYTLGSVQIPAVDPATLELKYIEISPSEVTYALSSDSKHDFINSFEDVNTRQDPVTVKDINGKKYYLWMIYDLGDKIYLFRGVSDLEEMLNQRDSNFDIFYGEDYSGSKYLKDISPLTEEDLQRVVNSVKWNYKNNLNIELTDIDFKLSKEPYYVNGEPSGPMDPPEAYGGCYANVGPANGTVYLNPDINLAISYYTHSDKIANMRIYWETVIFVAAHEAAHSLWYHGSEKYREEIVAQAKKEKFTSDYLDTIRDTVEPSKYREELFCEFLANQAIFAGNGKEKIDRSKCRPITKCEMLYIATSSIKDKLCTMTRYPAVEMGSIYPSEVVVVTTTPFRTVEMKSQWDKRVSVLFSHYPVIGVKTYANGTSIHLSKTPNLDAIKSFS